MPLPSWLYETTWIYHITALENLAGVLEEGCIHATNFKPNNHTCIANEEIQDRRARKVVELPPGGLLHDYTPFYFATSSPMLYANHMASFENAKPQDEIITLVTTAQLIHEAGLPYVFYDQHAATDYAVCYNDIDDLEQIDWELFFEPPLRGIYSKYWQDRHDSSHPKWINRKAVRQAEFLVHERLDWQYIQCIGTMNETRTRQIRSILSDFNDETPVLTKPEWYF